LVNRCYLKAADLGHTALPFETHGRWALRLLSEFYQQGDEERSLGLQISPMCERTGSVNEFRESQRGFLMFVTLPLFKELATVTLPEVGATCIARIEVNAEEWVKGEPSDELVAVVQAPKPPTLPSRAHRRSSKGSCYGSRRVSTAADPAVEAEAASRRSSKSSAAGANSRRSSATEAVSHRSSAAEAVSHRSSTAEAVSQRSSAAEA